MPRGGRQRSQEGDGTGSDELSREGGGGGSSTAGPGTNRTGRWSLGWKGWLWMPGWRKLQPGSGALLGRPEWMMPWVRCGNWCGWVPLLGVATHGSPLVLPTGRVVGAGWLAWGRSKLVAASRHCTKFELPGKRPGVLARHGAGAETSGGCWRWSFYSGLILFRNCRYRKCLFSNHIYPFQEPSLETISFAETIFANLILYRNCLCKPYPLQELPLQFFTHRIFFSHFSRLENLFLGTITFPGKHLSDYLFPNEITQAI